MELCQEPLQIRKAGRRGGTHTEDVWLCARAHCPGHRSRHLWGLCYLLALPRRLPSPPTVLSLRLSVLMNLWAAPLGHSWPPRWQCLPWQVLRRAVLNPWALFPRREGTILFRPQNSSLKSTLTSHYLLLQQSLPRGAGVQKRDRWSLSFYNAASLLK